MQTQAQFESLWFSAKGPWIVYFTAAWCKACKNLNIDTISEIAFNKNIPFYICDDTENDYTAGYCGVRVFPTFIYFSGSKKIGSQISNNNTEIVSEWLKSL